MNDPGLPVLPRFVRACSFDLFDTLVGRIYAEPHDLFLEVERRLSAAGMPAADFARLRAAAEYALRERRQFRTETTLREIYEELAARFSWTPAQSENALKLELQAEAAATYAVPAGVALLQLARRRRLRILFLSDTYLPRDFIAGRLREFGLLTEADHLYVSSETGVMKATGGLYAEVARREGLAPAAIVHVGDNENSDVRRARAAGFRAIWFQPTQPNRYEMPVGAPTLGSSLFHGVRRQLRLTRAPGSAQPEIYAATLGVSGPLVIAYTVWCLREAQRRGLGRLYFLSRDGEILHRVAQRLAPRLGVAIELRYLHVSRQALLLPALSEPFEHELGWILARTAVLTPRLALRRVNLAPDDLAAALVAGGFGPEGWDRHLDDARREQFARLLATDPLRRRVREQADRARERTLDYLRQQGLTEAGPYALVDIGWNGTLQRSISRLLEAETGGRPTTGFYFGLHSRRRHRESDVMVPAFSDYQNPTRLDSIDYLIPLLELFFAATHGGVAGYERRGATAQPVFRTPENIPGQAWGVATQQRAVLDLAEAWSARPEFDFDSLEALRDTLVRNLELFARDPTPAEARTYGAYLDAEDQNEAVFHPLARPYSWRELKAHRDRGFKHHHNEWKAAAVALTAPWLRRWHGVENRLDVRHPVFGPGLAPVRGFGPLEGPLANFHLPRFLWIYGPEAVLTVAGPQTGDRLLRLRLKNFHGGQALEFRLDGRSLTTLEVPANFGEDQREAFVMEIVLPVTNVRHELALRPKIWTQDDRPLGVILCSIDLPA